MKRAIIWALVIILAAGAGFFLRENVLGLVKVAGDSMSATLESGDVVLVTRYDYNGRAPERGDVVQAAIPGRDGAYLKRVIGLPGETLEITDGVVHINGQILTEAYATASNDNISVTLGGDEYFLMGDNRPDSYDSREEGFGAVSAGCFLGRVRAVVWPLGRIGAVTGG
jgi:signal peptidase I